MIQGKGFYIWRAEKVLEQLGTMDADRAAQRAVAANIQHVIVKIADGDRPFPTPADDANGQKESLTREMIAALRNAGIAVWGWAFAYGQSVDPDRQASTFAARAHQFGLNGLVINAEDYGSLTWRSAAGAQRAAHYVRRLRDEMADVAGTTLGLSSYRYIRFHADFPFAAFMEGCDVAMPQVYWVARNGGDAARNLLESYEDYKSRFPSKLFIPTGAAYGEQNSLGNDSFYWSASPQQIQRFLDQAQAMRFPAVTFWSWEHAFNDRQNQFYSGTQLWDAVASHPFTTATQSDLPVGESTLEIGVGDQEYVDGIHTHHPAALVPFVWQNRSAKYSNTVIGTPATTWALWRPDIQASGIYEISVWVPGNHATTRLARYTVDGVVGEPSAVTVVVNQDRFFNEWVPLGRFQLNAANPHSGDVGLTNLTGEADRRIAFSPLRWQRKDAPIAVDGPRLADGFDAPIGTNEERRSQKMWPGNWQDANPYGTFYELRPGINAYHTGADLNLNVPHWDADRDKPVYAVAGGVVTFAGYLPVWGNLLVIRHDPRFHGQSNIYARYAHLGVIQVQAGQRVQRGQPVGRVGQDAQGGPFHLHFDISLTEAMLFNPGDWPSMDEARLRRDYVDPLAFIRLHRPQPGSGETLVVIGEPQPSTTTPTHFVQRSGKGFVHNGRPFPRFIGVNLQCLAHYGDIDEIKFARPEHRLQQLQTAKSMGARVIRIFLANRKRPVHVVIERLRQVIQLIDDHHLDIFVIPALTNFYHNWGQFVQGDDEFYKDQGGMTVLTPAFFREGFRRNYLPYVEQVVHALKGETRIFAWQIGNELKAEKDPRAFVDFNKIVAERIKEIDPNHMVSTGMKSTQHAWMKNEQALRQELYNIEAINFVTIHSYENGPAEDLPDDRDVYLDVGLADSVGKPIVVQEVGIYKTFNGHSVDRAAELERHMGRWFNELGAYGYMQWGFDAIPNGDGDNNSGMARNDQDWDALFQRYKAQADRLALV